MGRHTTDGSCPRPELLLLCSLLLITSLPPTMFGSPAPQPARSPAPPGTGYISYISYGNLSDGPRPRTSSGRRPRNADNPAARQNASWSWVNRDTVSFSYADGFIVRPLLVRGSSGPSFACGFFCRASCNATLFSVFLLVTNGRSGINNSSGLPQVVWSANRHKPVGEGAVLQLTQDRGLELFDSDGTVAWSTGRILEPVTRMELAETGNLVLLDSVGKTVWESFNHTTDTVLLGQPAAGQRLVANACDFNSTEGKFFLHVTNDSFHAYINSVHAPTMYYSRNNTIKGGELLPAIADNRESPVWRASEGIIAAYQFLRLECDGHLKLYKWSSEESSWTAEKDLLVGGAGYIAECFYPTVCGDYGICADGQCSCPSGDYFQAVDHRKPNHGCSLPAPLSCGHMLVPLENISYFGYVQQADLPRTDVESCKEACLRSCSCKAAFFKFGDGKYRDDPSKGDCYLPSQIFSLIENQDNVTGYKSHAFLKVQNNAGKRWRVLGSTLGALLFALLLLGVGVGIALRRRRRRRRKEKDELEGYQLSRLPGMPRRFSYEELKSATGNFSRLLGEGGFGSVYQGTLADGMTVATKLLGSKGHGMKEFVAEVETIGSIHHVNLVRLVGYCAHKLHRLLVYEYMFNGSLDRWIFRRDDNNPRAALDWQTRHKIILHVAKGLAYLHEECRHRIAHLDIKPENILLDERFNAKVSDFGLSKLIERDQSRVLTTLRGTPGYLAPEWLYSTITEKVDVYSFGVVVLETVCGRRNIDGSCPNRNTTLVNEARSAARQERPLDIVDRNCAGIQYYQEEATKMVRIALCCLQEDPDRRPPMSAVVKLLEGVMAVEEPFVDFDPSASAKAMDYTEVYLSSSASVTPETLSQAR